MDIWDIFGVPVDAGFSVEGIQYSSPGFIGYWDVGASININATIQGYEPFKYTTLLYNQDGLNNFKAVLYVAPKMVITCYLIKLVVQRLHVQFVISFSLENN